MCGSLTGSAFVVSSTITCRIAVNKRVRGEGRSPRGLLAHQKFFQQQRPDVANTVRNSPFRTGRAGCSDCSAPASSSPHPGLEHGQPAAAIAAHRRLLRKSRPPNPSTHQTIVLQPTGNGTGSTPGNRTAYAHACQQRSHTHTHTHSHTSPGRLKKPRRPTGVRPSKGDGCPHQTHKPSSAPRAFARLTYPGLRKPQAWNRQCANPPNMQANSRNASCTTSIMHEFKGC